MELILSCLKQPYSSSQQRQILQYFSMRLGFGTCCWTIIIPFCIVFITVSGSPSSTWKKAQSFPQAHRPQVPLRELHLAHTFLRQCSPVSSNSRIAILIGIFSVPQTSQVKTYSSKNSTSFILYLLYHILLKKKRRAIKLSLFLCNPIGNALLFNYIVSLSKL